MTKWALVSVFDKRGIVPFCKQLTAAGYGILSTGGTAKALAEAGIATTAVEDYTSFPEMMNGRVKTLHPKIHGGLLGLRHNTEHKNAMEAHGIDPIDVVVVNLYPFSDTIAQPDATLEQAIEMIDIGGPSMLRSAAKNHAYCLPIIDPNDYDWLGEALVNGRTVALDERRSLAAKVFAATSDYDRCISEYLLSHTTERAADESKEQQVAPVWPDVIQLEYASKQTLRYGENPHQSAHFYAQPDAASSTIAGARQLQGKALSYNNIQDADAALNILRSLDYLEQAAVVAVKHMNPCGVGVGQSAEEAYARAYEADPVSIFGGIVAFNRPVDATIAERLTELFLEIVIAPAFTDEARAVFTRKKNVRLLTVAMDAPLWRANDVTVRRVSGGLLVQQVNTAAGVEFNQVTHRAPSANELKALQLMWQIVRHVKSNAIVIGNAQMTLGVGAGQMNRVGAARIALEQAGARAHGSVLASDAFFPMRDTLDLAAKFGVTAIVQPGGSIKDQDSIDAANEHGISMVFTGERHFLH